MNKKCFKLFARVSFIVAIVMSLSACEGKKTETGKIEWPEITTEAVPLKKYLETFGDSGDSIKFCYTSYLLFYINDSYDVDNTQEESKWTPEFFEKFKEIKGYELKNHLYALQGLDTDEMNRRVLYDYRVVISDLLIEQLTKNLHSKVILSKANCLPVNIPDLFAASNVFKIEENAIIQLKGASSAANVTGKKLISLETIKKHNDRFIPTIDDIKNTIDNLLIAGVNHNFYQGSDLNQYITRSQSFLQSGRPSNDILVYYAIADLWSIPSKNMLRHVHTNSIFEDAAMNECLEYLTNEGYSWDAISDKQLLDASFKMNSISAGGNDYKTLLVPIVHYMPITTFEKLMNLAKDGATILFQGQLPSFVAGFANLEQNQISLNLLKEKLSFKEKGNLRMAKCGKGKIIISNDISYLVAAANVKPESLYADGLKCTRRIKCDDNFYYFIKNFSEDDFEGWITLNVKYNSAALYDPMTGADGYVKTQKNNGKTEIFVQMKPQESLVIETFRGKY